MGLFRKAHITRKVNYKGSVKKINIPRIGTLMVKSMSNKKDKDLIEIFEGDWFGLDYDNHGLPEVLYGLLDEVLEKVKH